MRRRGFTLVELLCYLALVTAAMMIIAGLEYTAGRAATLERSLIDIGREADWLGTRFRDDVRQAATVETIEAQPEKGGAFLVTTMSNGRVIRYETEVNPAREGPGLRLFRRVFAKAGDAQPLASDVIRNVETVVVVRDKSGRRSTWRLEATFVAHRGPEIVAKRKHVYEAAPVAEEAP
jgi:hypothetical protein